MMGSKSPFVSPFGSRDLADRKKAEMAIGTSDHLTMWNAYNKVGCELLISNIANVMVAIAL